MLQAIVLGIIQGVTEFLPISSSGHLILVPKIFGWQDPGLAFDAIVHLATSLAVLLIFKTEIKKLLKSLRTGQEPKEKKENLKLLLIIILAAIPAGAAGFWFEDWVSGMLRSTQVVAAALIIGAGFLWWADRALGRGVPKITRLKAIGWKQSLVVGGWQILSLVPGFSRSGATITGGFWAGLDRKTAVKFSFLAGWPVIAGAGLWKLKDLLMTGLQGVPIMFLTVGFLSAALAGFGSLRWLLWLAGRSNFNIFVIYRVVLGITLLIFFV